MLHQTACPSTYIGIVEIINITSTNFVIIMLKAMRTSHIAENLLNRDFTGLRAKKVLLTDITYIPCNGVFFYLSTILDAFTWQVLAYMLSDPLEVDFVLETVNRLLEQHRISLSTETLIHSDQGCHYTSCRFIQIVKDAQLRQSMSRRGNCWDNAPQESFFGHMKDEIDLSQCSCFSEVKAVIDDWINYYNNDRYQWQLAKLSPNEYYEYITTGQYPLQLNPSGEIWNRHNSILPRRPWQTAARLSKKLWRGHWRGQIKCLLVSSFATV